jgi:hypothetical protein
MESKSHVASPSRTHESHVIEVAQESGVAIGELDMVIAYQHSVRENSLTGSRMQGLEGRVTVGAAGLVSEP